MATTESYFMHIPSEIRLQIYHMLLDDKGQNTFMIRNQDLEVFKRQDTLVRSTYRVLGRDLNRQSRPTTYCLASDVNLHTSIMAVNRKIHQETSYLLYGCRTFDFGRDIEAIVPFFSDLTRQSRLLLNEISLVKQGSVYSRDYDRCEWSNACEFLKKDMQLKSIKLTVEGGRPSLGWTGLPEYSITDFKTLSSVKYEALEWVWELLSIKGIRKLDVASEIHHCPPSHSSAMVFFAAFSASIETGFAEFLRSELLVRI
ncbi:hypothetical protein BJ875DRAFT_282067 [Amylocarpus encephaloides]|uniref:Uncharacterized protein n=1 Tax=Amylocarpus encephaloides TaxID=45428 RepID=A0A9P8C6B5_9HELO|nr:hypothetical protein BJ875DRAFT_282067 [Amylocarpus encephaloides]